MEIIKEDLHQNSGNNRLQFNFHNWLISYNKAETGTWGKLNSDGSVKIHYFCLSKIIKRLSNTEVTNIYSLTVLKYKIVIGRVKKSPARNELDSY